MKKHLIIFGSEGALGKASAEYFLTKNFERYYFFDRKYSDDELSSDKIKKIKTEDLSIEENVEKAFSQIIKNKEDEYFLFCTIGGFTGGDLLKDTSYEEWLWMQKINLNIPFLIGKFFFKFVIETKGGSICFTSAQISLEPGKKVISYSTSKNSLNYFVQSFAEEGKEFNIKVNAIAPSILDTKLNRKWIKDSSQMIHPKKAAELVNKIFSDGKIESGSISVLKSDK